MASGNGALSSNTTENSNTAADFQALVNNTTGTFNIALGVAAGSEVSTADDVICIGTVGANLSHSCYIGNISNQSSPSGLAVFVNSDGSYRREGHFRLRTAQNLAAVLKLRTAIRH